MQLYVPMAQDLSDDIFLVVRPNVRTGGGAGAFGPRARFLAWTRSSSSGVTSVMTLEDIAWAATGRHRFRAVMVMAFAGAGAGAGDGRRLRDARPTRFSSTCAISACAGRSVRRRTTCCVSWSSAPRASSPRGRRSGWCCRPLSRPLDRDDAVRRAAAGSGDVRVRDDRAGHHRRAVVNSRRARLAAAARRSGSCAL